MTKDNKMKKALLFSIAVLLLTSIPTIAQKIVEVELLDSRSRNELILQFGSRMNYGADLYRVTYETPDIYGQLDTASGLFIYPVGDDATTHVFPMLIYQHGTVGSRSDVPSELAGGYESALFWAGAGYATTAADYLGLGSSRGFHPYVHAETQATAAIDMHIAMKEYCQENDLYVNDQLFVTGYSQGGHAAAAAQKMIQEEYQGELKVTASAPMSGPYSISGVMRDLILGNEQYFFVAYAPYTLLSYDLEFDLFDDLSEVFDQTVAGLVQRFYDEEIDLWQLNQSLISWLLVNHGTSVTRHIFQDAFVDAIQSDPDHPVNMALRDNDLYDWAPEDPTRLYYCMADDQVPFMNSIIAMDTMKALGAMDVEALDVGSNRNHTQCVTPAFQAGYIFFSNYQEIGILLNTVQVDKDLAFQLSPNPANSIVDLRFDNGEVDIDHIEVIGLQGHTSQVFNDQNSMDISNLAAGIYMVKVRSDKGIWVERLIKQ
jgi:hypothetical protein